MGAYFRAPVLLNPDNGGPFSQQDQGRVDRARWTYWFVCLFNLQRLLEKIRPSQSHQQLESFFPHPCQHDIFLTLGNDQILIILLSDAVPANASLKACPGRPLATVQITPGEDQHRRGQRSPDEYQLRHRRITFTTPYGGPYRYDPPCLADNVQFVPTAPARILEQLPHWTRNLRMFTWATHKSGFFETPTIQDA